MAARQWQNIFGVLALALLFFVMAFSPASAEADKEKCTCNLQISGVAAGSTTVNAAACVRHEYPNWCRIFVAALEGTRSHEVLTVEMLEAGKGAMGTQPAQVPLLLMRMLDGYVRSKNLSHIAQTQVRSHRNKIESLAKQYSNLIGRCISEFEYGKSFSAREGEMTCSVGQESKWLTMTFRIERELYSFLFAPL